MAYGGNPNWPQLFAEYEALYGIFPGVDPAQIMPWTQLAYRLYGQWSTHRGQQYELGQQQPGEWDGQLTNKDGLLDPSNTGSLMAAGGVLPYRGWRLRAQYPPSANLFSVDQATGGEGTPFLGNVPFAVAFGGGTAFQAVVSATAFQGTQVFQTSFPAGTLVTDPIWFTTLGFSVVAAAPAATTGPYTFSAYVRCITPGANPQVVAKVGGATSGLVSTFTVAGSTATLTGSATAAWTRLTATMTPGSSDGTVWMQHEVVLTGTPPAGAFVVQVDGVQFEQAATASTFTVPGKTYPVFSGGFERYPQMWNHSGNYGLVSPIGTDIMASLSQRILADTFTFELNALVPDWYFPLDDPTGSVQFAEKQGRVPPAGVFVSVFGPGAITPGTPVTATSSAGLFTGAPGPVVNVDNTNTPAAAGTVIDLGPAGIKGPPPGEWTRMIAVRTTMVGASTSITLCTRGVYDGTVNSSFGFSLVGATAVANAWSPGGTHLQVVNSSVPVNDGNWHLWIATMQADGMAMSLQIDGGMSVGASTGTDCHPIGIVSDCLGGQLFSLQHSAPSLFIGDIAHCAQFPHQFSDPEGAALYQAWRNAFAGESSGARYSRILGYAGYQGATAIDNGVSTSLAAATDLAGVDALTALEDVVATENGQHFVAADGTLTFYGRNRRYLSTAPSVVFGDANPLGSQIPYVYAAFDFDTTHLANSVTVTQTSTGQEAKAVDAGSQNQYGTFSLARDNQSTSFAECQDAASYLLSRYKAPAMRIQSLQLDAASNPSVMFPAVLGLELGQRVRLVRTPPAPAPAITVDGFIDQITHSADDGATWGVNLQISPADLTNYGLFTSLHTTVRTTSTAPASTIVINALSDAAVNVLRANLTGGQQLVLDIGLPTQETVTIATGGVPVTSLGYTGATLTLTAPTTQNHAVGAVVSEPMPSGITSPTTYDTFGVFDAVKFSY